MRNAWIWVLVLGCAASGGPERTLARYGRALETRDYGESYELMSSSFRSRVSRETYARMMRDNPREVSETAKQLRSARGNLEISAQFDYGFGDDMSLVLEHGEWKLQSNPLAFYDQTSPKAALRSFVRAYRLARWDILLRFVPNAYRERMDAAKVKAQFTGASKEHLEALMAALEAHVDQPIVERGNDARMGYADKYEIAFIREDGIWKVKDLD